MQKGEEVKGKKGKSSYVTELSVEELNAADFDAAVIPGGSSPERLRNHEKVVEFIRQLNEQNKTVAGICHGPQVMISADILRNKRATCYQGIRDDVKNAGALYVDEEVVVDGNVITSRTPKDEPAFISEILKQLK